MGTWDVPVNGNFSSLDSILSDTFVQALTNVDVTLTLVQANNFQIALTGALTANINLLYPAIGGAWVLNNQTTGDFEITVGIAASSGSTVVAPSGVSQIALDGTNVFFTSNPPSQDVGKVYEYSGLFLPAGHLWGNGGQYLRTDFLNLFNATTAPTTANLNGTTTLSDISTDLSEVGLVGAVIEGPGISAGTTATAVTASTITMSQPATATANGVAIRLFPYGNGDAATTFNVIDKRERVGIGRGTMGGATDPGIVTTATIPNGPTNVAAIGGAETHVLTVAELAQHGHQVNDPGHIHILSTPQQITFNSAGGSTGPVGPLNQTEDTGTSLTGITLQNTGSNSPHLNMQPTIVCNYIVRF